MKRALVLLVVLACAKPSSNDLPPEAWNLTDYATAGLQIDKPWTAADFTHAAGVLEEITRIDRARLPRYRGAKSGAVFEKLIAHLPPDDDRSISERLGEHNERLQASNATSKLYTTNALAVPTRDWIELMGVLMHEASITTTLADQFLASIGPDDPSREGRLRGFAKMKIGFGSMLLGALIVAGDTRVPERDRIAMVKHATAALPVVFQAAPAEIQTKIREQAQGLVDGLPRGELRDAVSAAQRALR